jgi:hypothetical protein
LKEPPSGGFFMRERNQRLPVTNDIDSSMV